ncbi:sulfotransferase 1B1 [Patella vulgata]|uniref:sulfotransferase 1B1 n=1 Tax=Patella vulgata TaxID=6465 RepID=UPI002180340B|nr:sulfotransferase 1B1 [Patella vulgata]
MEAKPVKTIDGGGNVMKLMKIGDRLISKDLAGKWCGMCDIKARVDDVFIVEYLKSGLHWVYEIVSMLRSGQTELMLSAMESTHMEAVSPAMVDQMPSPRTLCTHRYPAELPRNLTDLKCKVILLIRNPKDVCVSDFYLLREIKEYEYEGSFNDFISLFKRGDVVMNSWDRHFFHWKKFKCENPNYPIHTVRYEDLKTRPAEEIKKIADFLDIECPEKTCQDIAKATDFPKMKQQKESLTHWFISMYKSGKEAMYRKGQIGDWKNHFSSTESESFDAYYRGILDPLDHIYLTDKPSPEQSN